MPEYRQIAAPSRPTPGVLVSAHLAVVIGGVVAPLVASNVAIRWGSALAAGTSLFALGALHREAIHGRLARRSWLNAAVGSLAGWPMLLPVAATRVFDQRHRGGPNGPGDPQRVLASVLGLALGLPLYALLAHRYAIQTLKGRERIAYAAQVAMLGVLTFLAVRCGLGAALLGPLLVAGFGHNLALSVGHWGLPAERYGDTWQVVLPDRLSRWLLHADHHLEQHLRPDVAWHALPLVRAEIDRGGFIPAWQRVTPAQLVRRLWSGRPASPVVSEPRDASPKESGPRWAGRAAIRARRPQPNHPSRESVIRLATD